jgi:hypothetical protein
MALMMGTSMAVIMLGLMLGMYKNKTVALEQGLRVGYGGFYRCSETGVPKAK